MATHDAGMFTVKEINRLTILQDVIGQAKGRVERVHLTLQDRLVKELRLKGICTIEAANAFAEEYMAGDFDMILMFTDN